MADSKAMIGGSSLSVKGGKTMVGGSTYAIKEGKTLIGGATNAIKFGTSFIEGQSITTVTAYAIAHSINGVVGGAPVQQSGGFTFPGVNNAFTYDSASGSQSFNLGTTEYVSSGAGNIQHAYISIIYLGYIDFTNYKTLSITAKTSYNFNVYILSIAPPANTSDNAIGWSVGLGTYMAQYPGNYLIVTNNSAFTTQNLDLTSISGSYYLVITGNAGSGNANAYIKSLSLS